MIDKVDQRIKDWIKDVTCIHEVHLGAPSNLINNAEDSVSLYLLNLRRAPLARGIKGVPLQITLHYLITTSSESPERSHRMLGLLMFSAMQHDDFDVETEGISPLLWQAFGVIPRPAFLLSVPLRKENILPSTPYVRSRLTVQQAQLVRLSGRLLGLNDHPLAGAKLELPQYHLKTYSGHHGEFLFSSVPDTTNEKIIRIRAKGKVLTITADKSWSTDEPLTIQFNTMEV